ncbi:MAG: amino acid permease [Candidatus Acidiferrales bacterium]
MSEPEKSVAGNSAERESGLRRQLSSRQISMMALGGAIGTGLFLGSAISVKLAGPAVILSYTAGAAIALAVMWALAEMAVAHPVAGSFGVYAEIYLHPWAGFAMRYSYWLAQAVAIGSEVVAASIYCRFWFPRVPAWMWIILFSALIVWINARSVGNFGTVEYWFALIKVTTIFAFLLLGAALLTGVGFHPIGTANFTHYGGFFPHGLQGVWLGVAMAIFSFMGIEVVAVAAGEAAEPEVAVPRAMRSTLARLALFYIGGMIVLVGVMPWTQAGLSESPFVRVFESAGIPAAAAVMNFVVLTAALSSCNTDLYLTTRMLFSLSRGGYAPASLGRLNRAGAPVLSLLISSVGMVLAMILALRYPEKAFVVMLGAAFFGGLFVWIMIFVTHLAFRRARAAQGREGVRFGPPGPWASLVGLAALLGVLISTWWIPGMKITLESGLPWLAFLSLCYFVWARRNAGRAAGADKNGRTSEMAE